METCSKQRCKNISTSLNPSRCDIHKDQCQKCNRPHRKSLQKCLECSIISHKPKQTNSLKENKRKHIEDNEDNKDNKDNFSKQKKIKYNEDDNKDVNKNNKDNKDKITEYPKDVEEEDEEEENDEEEYEIDLSELDEEDFKFMYEEAEKHVKNIKESDETLDSLVYWNNKKQNILILLTDYILQYDMYREFDKKKDYRLMFDEIRKQFLYKAQLDQHLNEETKKKIQKKLLASVVQFKVHHAKWIKIIGYESLNL